jgi:hypothetical protein
MPSCRLSLRCGAYIRTRVGVARLGRVARASRGRHTVQHAPAREHGHGGVPGIRRARPHRAPRTPARTVHTHNVVFPGPQPTIAGERSQTQCKCTCRRGSGPSAPARARFMGLIGCTRVLCRAVSWSSGMPDDNSEARALSARVASAAELLAANRAAERGGS